MARVKPPIPDVNEELYVIIKDVYARWSGEELARVIGQIRQEIQAEHEQARLKEQLAQLEQRLKEQE